MRFSDYGCNNMKALHNIFSPLFMLSLLKKIDFDFINTEHNFLYENDNKNPRHDIIEFFYCILAAVRWI